MTNGLPGLFAAAVELGGDVLASLAVTAGLSLVQFTVAVELDGEAIELGLPDVDHLFDAQEPRHPFIEVRELGVFEGRWPG